MLLNFDFSQFTTVGNSCSVICGTYYYRIEVPNTSTGLRYDVLSLCEKWGHRPHREQEDVIGNIKETSFPQKPHKEI